MIGLYVPGTSLLHRCPAGVKLVALLVLSTALLLARSVPAIVAGAVLTVVAYVAAHLGARELWQQVRPLRWFVVLLVPLQLLLVGPQAAFVSVGTLVVAVAAAGLVTLTTRTEDLLAVVERVLRPIPRVDADRIALLLILTIRAIPVLTQLAAEVGDARRARGLERSARAFVIPVVVRSIGHADRLGDALIARGVDD